MESDLDLDVEINNDVKDHKSFAKGEIFGKSTNHLNDTGEEKLTNSNSVPRSDFVAKYAHLEEFFKLESSKPRENGIFDMEFSCVKCLPVVKVLKTTTQAPMSNLRAHLKKIHADLMCQFDEKMKTSHKRTRKSTKHKTEKNNTVEPIISNQELFFDNEENYVTENPWSVHSIYDFSYFCCPECDSKWQFKQDFVDHALNTHPNSIDPIHHEITDGSLNDIELPDVNSLTVDVDVKVEEDSDYHFDFSGDIDLNDDFKTEFDEDTFAAKFEALESIFKFRNSHSKENGLFHLQFSCVLCEPEEKLLKTTTPSPMSNLRAHLKKIHPKTIHEFDELIRKTQGITRKKNYFTKKIKNEECLENNLVKQPSEENWEQFKTPKEQLRIAMPSNPEKHEDEEMDHKKHISELQDMESSFEENEGTPKREIASITNVNSDDLATRYKHIEEFFLFESSKAKDNGIIDMEFSCANCVNVKKVLKTSTQAPMSNLRAHLRKIHPDLMGRFDSLLRSTPRKARQKNRTVVESLEEEEDFNIENDNQQAQSENNEYAIRYSHIDNFFKFRVSKPREDGIVDLKFRCVKCLPLKKVLKTSSQAPMSNLRVHLRKIHPDTMAEFDELVKTLPKRPRKPKAPTEFSFNRDKSKKIIDVNKPYKVRKNHTCEVCGKCFRQKSYLESHKRGVHEGIKEHVCHYCGTGFAWKLSLQDHIQRIHEHSGKFICAYCDFRTIAQMKLDIHVNEVHTKAIKYPCPDCNFFCYRKGGLAAHIKTVHLKLKPHKCSVCPEAYVRRKELEKHKAMTGH